jgi:hypothetical protein
VAAETNFPINLVLIYFSFLFKCSLICFHFFSQFSSIFNFFFLINIFNGQKPAVEEPECEHQLPLLVVAPPRWRQRPWSECGNSARAAIAETKFF